MSAFCLNIIGISFPNSVKKEKTNDTVLVTIHEENQSYKTKFWYLIFSLLSPNNEIKCVKCYKLRYLPIVHSCIVVTILNEHTTIIGSI